jgi:hypothetical protein
MTPRLDPDGAECHPAHLPANEFAQLVALAAVLDGSRAGQRLSGHPALAALTGRQSAMGRLAAQHLGAAARPVRAVLFDKSAANNWPLGWHQDRTIRVRSQASVPGYGPFTRKQGLLHVQPPASLLAGMRTLRAHLDPCPANNAPLKVALGTHRLGLVPENRIAAEVARSEILLCEAGPGDVWVYHTLILHASDRAAAPSRRRVLQVDFAACDLPAPLSWAEP